VGLAPTRLGVIRMLTGGTVWCNHGVRVPGLLLCMCGRARVSTAIYCGCACIHREHLFIGVVEARGMAQPATPRSAGRSGERGPHARKPQGAGRRSIHS